MTSSIVITTCPNRKEAGRISDMILKKKFAACVKSSEVKSSYWWKGKIQRSKESLLMITTRKKNVPKIISAIKKIHSYEVPEIVELPITKGEKKYMRWISDVTE